MHEPLCFVKFKTRQKNFAMLKNYFKIAWRNLMKNKTFSFINIFGLSAGLACCMLIVLYLYNEVSYDAYHTNIKRLYQVGTTFKMGEKEMRIPATPATMAQAMKHDFPEIEEVARVYAFSIFGESKTLFKYTAPGSAPRSFYETKGFAADASFFKLFTYHFVEGNGSTALSQPNTVVITKEMAGKVFDGQPALNKVIRISSTNNGDHDCVVTGVFVPNSKPSHIDANFFISFYGGSIEDQMKRDGNNMAVNNMYTAYLLLQPGADPKKLEAKFPAFIDTYAGKDLREAGFTKKEFLVPVRDIHLHADMQELSPGGSVTYLYILGSIALFTLLIACINFMNLSTARSSKRSSEVGIRKVLGAVRGSLVRQFLGESLLMTFIAFAFAVLIMKILLPAFESVSDKNLALSPSSWLVMVSVFFGLAIAAGFLAGSYPAFYLSSFMPVKVLKGRFSNSLAAVSLRKGLVIFQFVISVVLIIASVVISGQMSFLRSTSLGFAKDQQIIIPLQSRLSKSVYPALKNDLAGNKQVLSVGGSSFYPGIYNPSDHEFRRAGQGANESLLVKINYVDETLLQTLQIKPVAGRLFAPEFVATDTNYHIILNENAIKKLGFSTPAAAIGQKLYSGFEGQSFTSEVVGVVKDFHFEDLHLPIAPYGFYLNYSPYHNYAIVHAGAGDMGALLKSIESAWHRLDPDEPFVYSFLDEDFQKNYATETRLASIVGYFTVIAILISCLGLFGLAAFSAEQRTKEIGVRKALGASVTGIVALLSKDFLKLVVIAIVIASPIAWFVMNKWLQDFTYRISISWVVFAITTGIALAIAMFTISFQAIKSALTNPVSSLRSE